MFMFGKKCIFLLIIASELILSFNTVHIFIVRKPHIHTCTCKVAFVDKNNITVEPLNQDTLK